MQPTQLHNDLKNTITIDQAWYYRIVPLKQENGTLEFTVDEQKNTPDLKSELEIILGKKIVLKSETAQKVEQLLMGNYPKVQGDNRLNAATTETYLGSPMPGRQFNNGNYRYGFNGKENDNEVKGVGNSVDFGARMYDSRLGRWSACDPYDFKYPFFSSYSFGADNPIFYIDPDGKKIEGVTIGKDGNYEFSKTAIKNGTDKYVLARISTPTGKAKIDALIADKKTYKAAVTSKVILMPTSDDGRYGIAGGGANAKNNSIVVGLNKARFKTVTESELADAVTIDKNGNLVPISITKDKLDNPLSDPNSEYSKANKAAYKDSGAEAMDENPDTKIKTEQQQIHAFGAHEETHLTKKNQELREKGDTYGKEKQAYEEEVKERKEYNDTKKTRKIND